MLPTGIMGDIVYDCGVAAGVDMSLVKRIPNSELGMFMIIPQRNITHFQRSHSAFALQDPSLFAWNEVSRLHSSTMPGESDVAMAILRFCPRLRAPGCTSQASRRWFPRLYAFHA